MDSPLGGRDSKPGRHRGSHGGKVHVANQDLEAHHPVCGVELRQCTRNDRISPNVARDDEPLTSVELPSEKKERRASTYTRARLKHVCFDTSA